RQGVYLYGFTRPGVPDDAGCVGVDGHVPVVALDCGGVSALVSEVPLEEFEAALGGDEPPDPSWIVPRACGHERVVAEVMARAPVLPVRFGTIFSTRQAVEALSAAHGAEITRFLDHVADKQEWAVKAHLDLDAAEEGLLQSDPTLADRHRRLPDTPGTRYFQEKKLRIEARAQAKGLGRAFAEEGRRALLHLATQACFLPLPAPREDGRLMVLRAAVLLPGARVDEFLARIEQIAAPYRLFGLAVEPTGPWPPFHFCPDLGAEYR
ncbi:MAG TPA: GvpL/GvpF family gas vesicle protein, partial [Isosphaeraceae bacterium]